MYTANTELTKKYFFDATSDEFMEYIEANKEHKLNNYTTSVDTEHDDLVWITLNYDTAQAIFSVSIEDADKITNLLDSLSNDDVKTDTVGTTSWETVLHNMADGRRKVTNVHYVKIEDSYVLISVEYKTTKELYSMTYEDAVELNIYHKYLPDDIVEQLTKSDSAEEYDEADIVDVQAMLDDAEEIRLIAEYNKIHADGFKSHVNSISEAANEGLNNVFGYVSEALDNLITAVQNISDPYLNMMYADEDFEAFINYDPSDNYYVDDFAECYAA